MKKNKKSTLIEKHDVMQCWACGGYGRLSTVNSNKVVVCKTCKGTGIWVEKHYIIIDNKNKIAFDTDTGA